MAGVHPKAGSCKTSFVIPFVGVPKEVTCTPLAFLAENVEQKSDLYLELAQMIIQKGGPIRTRKDEISPLLALFQMDRTWEPDSPERRMFNLLVENGADIFDKYRADISHSGDIFVLPLLKEAYNNLLFLLMEVLPGKKVFGCMDVYYILSNVKQYERIQSATQIETYFQIVNCFVPQLPYELLRKFTYTEKIGSETKEAGKILTVIKTPKNLKDLSALQIREQLWKANKKSFISNSVEVLKNEIGLLEDFVDLILLKEPINSIKDLCKSS